MRLLRRRARTEPTAAGAPVRRAAEPATTAGPARERRRGVRTRTRDAGAATAGAVGTGVVVFARLVMAAAVLIALLIGLGIVLYDVDANASNTIVEGIHEGANFFAGSFTGLITIAGHTKRELTIDWGIALIVYLLVGALLATLIARIGRTGVNIERRHRAVSAH